MNPRTQIIRQLIRESHYVVDAGLVAESIVIRARARSVVPQLEFRSAPVPPAPRIRSFRPCRGARSFRLQGSDRLALRR